MTHVDCESKLRSVVRSTMPSKLDGNRACGRVNARAAHAFSAGSDGRHCRGSSLREIATHWILSRSHLITIMTLMANLANTKIMHPFSSGFFLTHAERVYQEI